jgi:hypothetical protein
VELESLLNHIIDDFLFIGPPNSDKSLHDLNYFLQLCNRIGIPIKAEKTVYPTTVITIYGIEIDSNKMECRLPVEICQNLVGQQKGNHQLCVTFLQHGILFA